MNSSFAPIMHRIAATLIMASMVVPTLLSGFLVARFVIQQERIARELCVQRGVSEAERTCHGQCHLMKELDHLEKAPAQMPEPRLVIRTEPMVVDEHVDHTLERCASPWILGDVRKAVLAVGFRSVKEPVPWG